MITLKIDLKSFGYGAKPWNHSSYAGTVEVPPSPYRIIRSIGYGMFIELESQGQRPVSQLSTNTEGDIELPENYIEILEKLASVSPSFYVPDYVIQGSKSFAPQNEFRPLFQSRTEPLRFFMDAWARFSREDSTIFVYYDIELTEEQEEILESVLENITYLGRSEFRADWYLTNEYKEPNYVPDNDGLIQSVKVIDEDKAVEWALKSTKEIRMLGFNHNPSMKFINYSHIKSPKKLQTIAEYEGMNVVSFAFMPSKPVDTARGLEWTDVLHKTLVKFNPESVKFTGFEDNEIASENDRIWYQWTSDNSDNIQRLDVISNIPFTTDEMNVMTRVRRLRNYRGETANVMLLGMKHEEAKVSTKFKTVTPALLYTNPRKGRLHRAAEGQIINTIFFTLSGNEVDDDRKITEFTKDEDGVVTGVVPDFGWVRVRVTSTVKEVTTRRGNRKSPFPMGFMMEIETEHPINLPGVGFSRRFGSGKLQTLTS